MADILLFLCFSVLVPPTEAESSVQFLTLTVESPDSEESKNILRVHSVGQDVVLSRDTGETLLVESAQDSDQTVVVEITSSDETRSDEDSKPRKPVRGRVVVTGPDGETREYSLNGTSLSEDESKRSENMIIEAIVVDEKHPSREQSASGDKSDADADSALESEASELPMEERWVIGVQCEETSDLLRSHLKLGDAGLVILEVREDTPASAAGLKQHDIIVSINGEPMKNRDELIEAVLGSEGSELELSIIREGEPQTKKVTPRKMKVQMAFRPAEMDLDLSEVEGMMLNVPSGVRIRRIHPGVMLEGLPQWEGDVDGLVRQLRELADTQGDKSGARIFMAPSTDKEKKKLPETKQSNEVAELRASVKSLQEQVNVLKKSLQSLQKSDSAEINN